MADPGMVSISAIAIGQTVVAYQFFLPRISEVRRADPSDAAMQGDVVLGQIGAGAVSMAVAVVVAVLSGSAVPVWVALVVAAIIAGIYHYAMNGSR